MGKAGREDLKRFLLHPRYEIIPLGEIEERVGRQLRRVEGLKLTVTASPTKGIGATVDLAVSLSGRGYEVVPHLSARLIRDEEHLSGILERLGEAGVREAFVIGGDAKSPLGVFEDALSLLRAMDALGHPFQEIGIAGYPEGHPLVEEEDLGRILKEKAPYASYIATQICFDAEVIGGWIGRVRRTLGVELPVYVGLPGPVDARKLARIAGGIGLGQSARFLQKQRSWVLRLLLPFGYRPNRLLEELEGVFEDPEANVAGLHINTFNELARVEAWRAEILRKL